MIRKILVGLLAFVFLFLSSNSTKAQSTEPTQISLPEKINSFEVFWPLSAGKTEGDSLYFLKTLKEKLRGVLIFGTARKTDYQVLLGTKRVIEAEKLIDDKKSDLAIKSLDASIDFFKKAKENVDKMKASKENLSSLEYSKTRAENVNKLALWLATKTEGNVKEKLNTLSSTSLEFVNSLK